MGFEKEKAMDFATKCVAQSPYPPGAKAAKVLGSENSVAVPKLHSMLLALKKSDQFVLDVKRVGSVPKILVENEVTKLNLENKTQQYMSPRE